MNDFVKARGLLTWFCDSGLAPTNSALALFEFCDVCGTATHQRCGGCSLFRYCSDECSIMHWPEHQTQCRAFTARMAQVSSKHSNITKRPIATAEILWVEPVKESLDESRTAAAAKAKQAEARVNVLEAELQQSKLCARAKNIVCKARLNEADLKMEEMARQIQILTDKLKV